MSIRHVTPCRPFARWTSWRKSRSRATYSTVAPGLALSWFMAGGRCFCQASNKGFRSRHHTRYSREVSVMGLSLAAFLGSMTTMCICC